MYEFSDFDIDCQDTGFVTTNGASGEYVVQVKFLESVKFALFTEEDLLTLLKMLKEGGDR